MWDSFISGAIAGYAIAIPVGAIAVLILETGLKRGFWHGLAAGSGAATADLIYATIAATLGVAVAQLLDPIAPILRLVSAGFLVAMGAAGLYKTRRMWDVPTDVNLKGVNASIYRTYVMLLALTVLNPATIAYFAALILGGTVGRAPGTAEKVAFVAGVVLASWSWQSLLAAIGALAHRHMPSGFRRWTSIVGNFIIIVLGITILL